MKFKWSAEEIALVGTAPDSEVAKKLGVSRMMVGRKRNELNIPPYPKKACGHGRELPFEWTEEALALLGTEPDMDVAMKLGISRQAVFRKRKLLKRKAPRSQERKYKLPDEAVQHLGVMRDVDIAKQYGVPPDVVYNARRALNIAAPAKPTLDYEAMLPDLGKASDTEVAAKHNTTYSTVRQARLKHDIPAFKRGQETSWVVRQEP